MQFFALQALLLHKWHFTQCLLQISLSHFPQEHAVIQSSQKIELHAVQRILLAEYPFSLQLVHRDLSMPLILIISELATGVSSVFGMDLCCGTISD